MAAAMGGMPSAVPKNTGAPLSDDDVIAKMRKQKNYHKLVKKDFEVYSTETTVNDDAYLLLENESEESAQVSVEFKLSLYK